MSRLKPAERLKLVNKMQSEACEAWFENSCNGTAHICTGGGKSWVIMSSHMEAYKQGLFTKDEPIDFFAPYQSIIDNFVQKEIPKFREDRGVNPLEYGNWNFYCYASKKGGNGVIKYLDEPDEGMTTCYHVPFITPSRMKLATTATIPYDSNVFISKLPDELKNRVRQSARSLAKGKMTTFITKGQMIDKYVPIFYSFPLEQGIKTGILSPYETVIVYNRLGKDEHTYKKSGKKTTIDRHYKWMEAIAEDYKGRPDGERGMFRNRCTHLLRTLPEKSRSLAAVLAKIPKERKVLAFNPTLSLLEEHMDIAKDSIQIELVPRGSIWTGTNWMVDSQVVDVKTFFNLKEAKEFVGMAGTRKYFKPGAIFNDWEVLSNERTSVQDFVDLFDQGKITRLGSAQALRRGVTLDGLTDVIIVGFNSKFYNLQQIIGRLTRYGYNKIGKIWILVTIGSWEERWLRKAQEITVAKQVVDRVPLNVVSKIFYDQLAYANLNFTIDDEIEF